jgi:hypothetical protein
VVTLLHQVIENNDQAETEHVEAEIASLNTDLETNLFDDHYITIGEKEAAGTASFYDILPEDAIDRAMQKVSTPLFDENNGVSYA